MQGTAPVIRATWVPSGDVSQNRRHGDVHGVVWKCITKLALCNRSCGVGIQKRECSEIGAVSYTHLTLPTKRIV